MTGSYKSLLTAAIVAVAMLAGGSQADAFFFGHGCHGCHGCWGGCHGCWGGGWGGCHGCWGGCHGCWGGCHGCWGGCHGSWGCYGCSGGYGCYGCSGGCSGGYAYGCYGCSGGATGYYSAPVYGSPIQGAPASPAAPADGVTPPMPPAPGGAAPLPAPAGTTSIGRDAALLSVHVPAEARVFVNELATRSTGSDRRYMSRGLAVGREYTYTVRAEVERDGKLLSETKVIKVQGGQASDVNFTFENAQESIASKPLRTALILNVPADAKVFLAGKETITSGAVREFATTKLAAGDAWKDYTVRVEIQRGGRTLTKEETVSVTAGEARELSFNFDAPEVARVTTADVGL